MEWVVEEVTGEAEVVAVGVEKEWVAEEVIEEAEVVAGVVVAALSVVTGWRARTTQGQKG